MSISRNSYARSLNSEINELEKSDNIKKVGYISMVRFFYVDYNSNDKLINISMNLPNFYPSSTPTNIIINHHYVIDYELKFYRFLKGNQHIIKKYFKIDNLSDESILNPRKWRTKFKIIDIIHEFELFKSIASSSILFYYFENKNLLNEDILYIISSYIK